MGLARRVPWKGHQDVIGAVHLLRTRGHLGDDIVVAFNGAGMLDTRTPHYEQHLREHITRRGLDGVVVLLDELSPQEVVGCYAGAHVAVHPSREPEPFGYTNVEAMLAGVPIIATAHGGPAEYINHGRSGLLVPPRNPQAIAQALHRVLTDMRLHRRLAPRPWENANGDEDVRRREFLTATAGAGLAAALTGLAPLHAGKQLDKHAPNQLRERAARLRRLDDVLGGGDTHRAYLGEYLATKRLVRDCDHTEDTGRALLSVLAEQAQQAGWAAFDAGRHDDARSLYEESHHAATAAADPSLAGNALAFLAYQEHDPRAAVHIAVQSCHTAGPGAPSTVRALLHERRAWAHAVTGDATEAVPALDAAVSALSEPANGPQPDWAAWVDDTELKIMTGRCWAELGRPLRAVPALEQALARFDDAHARDKALYMSWLASSYLSAGEVEQAAVTVSRVLELSTGVASVRPRQRAEPILHQLQGHRRLPVVADALKLARAG